LNDLYHLNRAMDYIEQHLSEEIDYKNLSELALTSETYLKRLFSFLSGIPISEYIRRRRMTQAGYELKNSNIKVIDLAVKYGYSSPDAFTKAFYQIHGMSPTDAREGSSILKTYPKMTFRLDIQGGESMDYKIIEKEAFIIAGYKTRAIVTSDGESKDITSFLESMTDDHYNRLMTISSGDFNGLPVYVSTDIKETENERNQDFYLGVPVSEIIEGIDHLKVSNKKWAVFSIYGDWERIDETWTRIYTEWFPSSDYEPEEAPQIMASNDEKTEIWVAVR